MRWWKLLLLLLLYYFAVTLLFALLYWMPCMWGGTMGVTDSDCSLLEAFFFSTETISTIGTLALALDDTSWLLGVCECGPQESQKN